MDRDGEREMGERDRERWRERERVTDRERDGERERDLVGARDGNPRFDRALEKLRVPAGNVTKIMPTMA